MNSPTLARREQDCPAAFGADPNEARPQHGCHPLDEHLKDTTLTWASLHTEER